MANWRSAGARRRRWWRSGGTPLFVYSLEMIRQRLADLRAMMPERLAIHYAVESQSFRSAT